MTGLLMTLKAFKQADQESLVKALAEYYPDASESQVQSWRVLIDDVRASDALKSLPESIIIGMEYSLPTDDMAADLLFAGKDKDGRKTVCIVESKQWSDDYISQTRFSTYRREDRELHPQIQVERHALSFRDYLDIGSGYHIVPAVFMRNASEGGLEDVKRRNPRGVNASIPVFNDMARVVELAAKNIETASPALIQELTDATLQPSKSIFDAMKAVVDHEEPFILTDEQKRAVVEIRESIREGKKIIRIVGPAGSGKTAILLNLYVGILACSHKTGYKPIFISGRQNTALYRATYPQAEGVFTYPCTLERTLTGNDARRYIILMDEAQHNDEGVVTSAVDRGATVVLCYDPSQVVSGNNPIDEFKRLEAKKDFKVITLQESVRYNGSQVAEKNIRACLEGRTDFAPDDRFEFNVYTEFADFERKIFSTIDTQPDSTLAVVSQLKFGSGEYGKRLFCEWSYRSECQWMPYVRDRNYLSKYGGKLWVGTWWLPGLDVDYVAVIVGKDLVVSNNGVAACLENNKLFKPAIALGQRLGVPANLMVNKPSGYGDKCDYVQSYKNTMAYLRRPEMQEEFLAFKEGMTEILRNNYYIMMTRGRKGCFVYFA